MRRSISLPQLLSVRYSWKCNGQGCCKAREGPDCWAPEGPDVIKTFRMVLGPSVVAITLSSNICEFGACLVYKANFRPDRAK